MSDIKPQIRAVSLKDASNIVGMSTGQFRRVFLDGPTPLLQSIRSGKRDRIIDLEELNAVYEQYRDSKRRDQCIAETTDYAANGGIRHNRE